MSLEMLEERALLDSSGFPIGPWPLVDPPTALVGSVDPAAAANPLAAAYTPPSGVQAWVDGTTVRYQVVDPNTNLTVTGETVYDASLSIVELINRDGVVAWTVGHPDADGIHTARVAGFAVYDTNLGAWKQSENGLAGVLSIADLDNRDGVVTWTIGYPNADVGYTARELGAATYDANLADWSQFKTRTSGGVRTIGQFQNQDRVVAWTLGHANGSGGVTIKDIAFAKYDDGLGQWQRYQINGSNVRTVLDVVNIDGTVAWTIGDPTDSSAGTVARNVGFAGYDTSAGQWQHQRTRETDERTVSGLTNSDGLVAWKIAPDGSGTRDVGAAVFDAGAGAWEFFETSYSSAISIVDFSATDGVVAWSLNSSNFVAASAAQAVGFAAFDAGEHEWQQSQTPTSGSIGISDLTNDAGIVSWKQATADSSDDSFVDRSVGAATYDATRTTWTRFLSASDADRSLVDLVNANRAVAWTITGTSSGIARNVGYVTYDVSLGQWRQEETSNGGSVTILGLAADGGNIAWRTDRNVFAVRYDLGLRQWQSYRTSNTGDVRLVDFEADDGMIAWTIGYYDSNTDEYPARDVGAVIYDVALAQWQPLSVPFASGQEVDYFAIDEFAIEFTVEGTDYTRGYDTGTQAWADAATTPLAFFNSSASNGAATATAFFGDASIGAEEWTWDFGDGNTAVTQDATHVYDAAGIYTVQLDVVGPGGTDSTTTTVIVSGSALSDLGQLDFQSLADQTPGDGSLLYQFEATRDGLFTSVVSGAGVDAGTEALLGTYDAQGQPQQLDSDTTRLDYSTVVAGETYWLLLRGLTGDVDLLLADLVVVDQGNSLVTVYGTSGADTFSSTIGSPHQIEVNGIGYTADQAQISTIAIDGLAGYDTVTVTATSGNELINLRPGSGEIAGSGFDVDIDGVESITVNGAGGADEAHLFDSAGDDTFTADPNDATLSGSGFSLRAHGVEEIHAYAKEGGTDIAHLFDASSDDRFVGREEFGKLSGTGFLLRAKFFDQVHAYAKAGGNDTALLFDSSGDDSFVGREEWSKLSGSGFFNRAKLFDAVFAYSSGNGYDTALLFDSAGNDRFTATRTVSTLSGSGFSNYAKRFDFVTGLASGGTDTAHLYDSSGDDTLTATPTKVVLTGPGVYLRAKRFDSVTAHASGGTDTAHLYDSAGNDTFTANPNDATLSGSGFSNRAVGFVNIHAYAKEGGNDVARLYDSSGNDSFIGRADWSKMSGAGFLNRAKFFDEVHAHADNGGVDLAYLWDSAFDDLLDSTATQSTLQSNNARVAFLNSAYDFEAVTARRTTGTDTANVDAGSPAVLLGGW